MKETVTLGKLIDGPAERDAVHVAVCPVVAGEDLWPGAHVGISRNGVATMSLPGNGVGIVDPFLTKKVDAGQRCYLFLYPGTVTSLRHHWSHPAFESQLPTLADVVQGERGDDAAKSRAWIAEFAEQFDLDYEGMMAAAEAHLKHNDYIVEHGRERWRDLFYDHATEFWTHYELVTGEKVEDKDAGFFSCSC